MLVKVRRCCRFDGESFLCASLSEEKHVTYVKLFSLLQARNLLVKINRIDFLLLFDFSRLGSLKNLNLRQNKSEHFFLFSKLKAQNLC